MFGFPQDQVTPAWPGHLQRTVLSEAKLTASSDQAAGIENSLRSLLALVLHGWTESSLSI